jgi:hypothetical protein
MKKSMRKRVIHLVATGRFRTVDELVNRLRKDGVDEHQTVDETKSLVVAILDEVSR